MINRRKNNRIEKIKSNSCYWMDSREEIGVTLCDSLRQSMTSSGPRNLSEIKNLITNLITPEENQHLIAIPLEEEVWKAMLQIESFKAPGLDVYRQNSMNICGTRLGWIS